MLPKIISATFLAISCYSINSVSSYRCSSYCDDDGYYVNTFYCYIPKGGCCGNINIRYCCSNGTSAASDIYPDVFMCPKSSWWLSHWQVALGMMGGVIILLLVAACCCRACLKINPRARSSRSSRRHRHQRHGTRGSTVSTVSQDGERRTSSQVFNPDAPFAFEPPAYESLPKDPPKYIDVFGQISGNQNLGFISESPELSDLPPYSLYDVSNAAPGTSTVITMNQAAPSNGEVSESQTPKDNDVTETPIYSIQNSAELQAETIHVTPAENSVEFINNTNNDRQNRSNSLEDTENENNTRDSLTL